MNTDTENIPTPLGVFGANVREVSRDEYYKIINLLNIEGSDIVFPRTTDGGTRYAVSQTIVNRRPVAWAVSDMHSVEPRRYFLPAQTNH